MTDLRGPVGSRNDSNTAPPAERASWRRFMKQAEAGNKGTLGSTDL